MKVLLIQSHNMGAEAPVFPLGLACVAAALSGYTVRAFDPNTSPAPYQDLGRVVEAFGPDVVGISLRNIDSTNKRRVVFYYKGLSEVIDVIRARSRARIIVGGSGFSMFAEAIMADEPRIDFGVVLEGEQVFPRLLDHLDGPVAVPQVYYRDDGRVRFSGCAAHPDPAGLPGPDYDLLPVTDYTGHPDALGVETKRGCALSCVYCIYGFLNGRAYRLRNPAAVVDDIQALKERGAPRFTFIDSVFNLPEAHARAVLREMIHRKVDMPWSAWLSEKGLSADFLDLAVRAGLDHAIFSPDGFSDPVLKALGKAITTADIKQGFATAAAFQGLEISYNFFKNPPGQHWGNFLGMARFVLSARARLGRRVHFEFNSLRIEPHTGLFDIAVREKVITGNENLLYPKYYTNRQTWYIQAGFDTLLRLAGK